MFLKKDKNNNYIECSESEGEFLRINDKDYIALLERAFGSGDSGGSITFEEFLEIENDRKRDLNKTI